MLLHFANKNRPDLFSLSGFCFRCNILLTVFFSDLQFIVSHIYTWLSLHHLLPGIGPDELAAAPADVAMSFNDIFSVVSPT